MRILHILDHSIPLHSGYAFRTMNILKEQRAHGWHTSHVTSSKHRAGSGTSEIVDGWIFYRTPAPTGFMSRISVGGQLSVITATAKRLDELVPVERPDILHAHSPVLNAISALRCREKFHLPVVYEVRGFWEDAAVDQSTAVAWGPRYRMTRFLESRAFRKVQAVTTICQGLHDEIIQRGIAPEKVTIIPNGVDVDVFSGDREMDPQLVSQFRLAGKTVLGFVGSFYSYEGIDSLITALPGLLTSLPKIKILLVGQGPDESRLKKITNSLGLENHVVFVGPVPHREIQKFYNLMDIMIYPRRSMRLTELVTPLKPLEAMALNRVVIASNVGGHRELIRDGETGYFFQAGDTTHLSKKIVEVVEDRENWDRIRVSARSFVERERTWRASVGRYERVYQDVLRDHRSSAARHRPAGTGSTTRRARPAGGLDRRF